MFRIVGSKETIKMAVLNDPNEINVKNPINADAKPARISGIKK
jgi:hypothetical protein